jgi:hypothetical protein
MQQTHTAQPALLVTFAMISRSKLADVDVLEPPPLFDDACLVAHRNCSGE